MALAALPKLSRQLPGQAAAVLVEHSNAMLPLFVGLAVLFEVIRQYRWRPLIRARVSGLHWLRQLRNRDGSGRYPSTLSSTAAGWSSVSEDCLFGLACDPLA
jgi:hypothetical protein